MKDCIVVKSYGDGKVESYEFVSKEGISYQLYDGDPICKKGKIVSLHVFITFFPYFEDEELLDDINGIMGCQEMYVGFFIAGKQWEKDNLSKEADEYTIRKFVDDFEKKHPDIVEFMKQYMKEE